MQTKLGANSTLAEDDTNPNSQIPLGDTFAPQAANNIPDNEVGNQPEPLSNQVNDLRNLTIDDAPETFQRKASKSRQENNSQEIKSENEHSSVGEYEEEKADRMGQEMEDPTLTNSLGQEIGESPSRLDALQNLTFMGRNAPLNNENQEATGNFKTPTLTSLQNTRQKLIDSPQIATLKSSLQSSENYKIDKIGAHFGEQMANEELTLQDKDIFINTKEGLNPDAHSPGQDPSDTRGSNHAPVNESGRDTADLLTKSQILRKANLNIKQEYSNEKVDVKKQALNMNLISYQTANFGASGDQAAKRAQGKDAQEDTALARNESKQSLNQNHMFSSMSDINFVAAASDKKQNFENIITEAQRQKMLDTSNHWKIRTSMIDEIHITIQQTIDTHPERILFDSEGLLEFFVQLLNDQNFKIVLMTLSIINLVIGMPQHVEISESGNSKSTLSSQSLGKYIPRLVGKLADSKNIIRQQAIRALMGIYLIMRSHSIQSEQKSKASPVSTKGQTKTQNNFVPLVLPYLCNSSSWHVREELLNVLIICFLKSKNIEAFGNSVYEFDQYKILEVLLQMLDDQKERIRFTALEAIVAFVSIGNKLSAQEIIYQLGDNSISELIKERLKAPSEMCPYLNENGALELPYLEHVEIANQMQVDQVLQKREGLNSGPAGQVKNLSSNVMGRRGNSSGRKVQVAPQSANSIANAAQNANMNKRTASANNPKYVDSQYYQQNHVNQLGMSAKQQKHVLQSPMYNVFSNHKTALSDFGGSGSSAPPINQHQQYGSSYRLQNQRQSNERLGSGSSSFLPQLQKQSSMRNQNQETPTHSLYQQQQYYGASAGPLHQGGVLQSMIQRGQPGSENRFYSHQSEPGSSFYANNLYNRQVSANSQNQAQQVFQSGQSQFVGHFANHPINLLKNGNEFDDGNSDIGYLGIKHPPIQMLNQHHKTPAQNFDVQSTYYKKNDQHPHMMLQHNLSESQQSRANQKIGSNQVLSKQGSASGQAAPPYETQTQSSYYSRKNTRSQGTYSIATQNSNRVAGNVLNSGGSMGEGPLHFTPVSHMVNGGGPSVGGVPQPQSYIKNGNTFYSDGSMMTNTTTTSTQVANKLKQKQHLQLSLVGKAPNGQQMPASGEQQQVLGVNRGGPVKATRYAVMSKENSNRDLNQAQATKVQPSELCIDNRKPKRPLGSETYKVEPPNSDLAEFIENFEMPKKESRDLDVYMQISQLAPGENQLRDENFTILSNDKQSGATSELGMASVAHNKDYLTPEELKPIQKNAVSVFKSAMGDLVSGADWNIQFEACNVIRRVCKYHQDLVLQHGATLHSLVKQLTKLADSLRSSLSKVALITIRDMFQFLKRCMETYLDPLIKILLKKRCDTSIFISDEAMMALITMTNNCSDSKILSVILAQNVNSKNNVHRLSISRCLEQLVTKLGNNILFFKDSDKLICQLTFYLKDACQDVRASSKRAFVCLQNAIMGQKDLDKLLLRVLNEEQYKKVRSFLDQESVQSDYYSQPQQQDFVIKNANQNQAIIKQQQISVASPTDIGGGHGMSTQYSGHTSTTNLGKSGQETLSQQADRSGSTMQLQISSQSNAVALGQNASKHLRAMGAAKGTLRTGTMATTKMNQNNQLVQSASGTLNVYQSGALNCNGDAYPAGSGLSVQSAFGSHQLAGGNGGDLNIKATKIINPVKIVKKGGRPNLKTKNSYQSQSSVKESQTKPQVS